MKIQKSPLFSLNQSGQLIVEYVLLLAIATAVAMIIRLALVKTVEGSPGESGAVMSKWHQITQAISKDDPNKR